jgi:hypothetical protein
VIVGGCTSVANRRPGISNVIGRDGGQVAEALLFARRASEMPFDLELRRVPYRYPMKGSLKSSAAAETDHQTISAKPSLCPKRTMSVV